MIILVDAVAVQSLPLLPAVAVAVAVVVVVVVMILLWVLSQALRTLLVPLRGVHPVDPFYQVGVGGYR